MRVAVGIWGALAVSLLAAAAPAADGAPGAVQGVVVAGEHDMPQAGREVTLLVPGETPRTTKSDRWGRFEFADVPARGPCELRVEAEDCATARVPEIRLVAHERRDVGNLWLGPPTPLDVVVLDDRGAPIPGATVDVFREATGPMADCVEHGMLGVGDAPTFAKTSDAAGRARFYVPQRESWTVVARAPGRARIVEPEIRRPLEEPRTLVMALPPASSLTGRVVDPTGKGVAGARIFATRNIPMVGFCATGWHAPVGHARLTNVESDAEGRFAFDALAPGDVVVFAETRDAVAASVLLRVPAVRDIEMTLRVADRVIVHAVDAATGAGVPNVVVGAFRLAATDAEGFCILDRPPTEVQPPPGWTFGRGEDLGSGDVRLRRAGVVTGRVTDDGKPVPGAVVEIVSLPEELDGNVPAVARGRADASGAFRIENVLPGRAATFARSAVDDDSAGYGEFIDAVCRNADGRAKSAFDVVPGAVVERDVEAWRLSDGGKEKVRSSQESRARWGREEEPIVVHGRVTTADGVPLLDARVLASPEASFGRDALREHLGRAPAPDGRFVCEWYVTKENRKIAVCAVDDRHDVGVVADVNVPEGVAEVEVNVVLPALPVLTGRVVAGGKPVAGARILRYVVLATTDAAGAFAVPLAAGPVEDLEVDARGFVRRAVKDVEMPRAEPLVVELAPAFVLAGRVVDETGCGRTAIDVIAQFEESDRPRMRATTDVGGAFRFEGLETGAWTLRVASRFAGPDVIGETVAGPFDAGATDVRVVVKPGRRIAGRVLFSENVPARRVDVTCTPEGDGGRKIEMRTDESGRFAFTGLAEGKFVLDVDPGRRREFAPLRRVVESGAADLELVLSGAGSVAGVLVGDDGAPLADVEIEAVCLDERNDDAKRARDGNPEAKTDAAGAFRIYVPSGTRFRLLFGRFSRIQDVALTGGEDVAVGRTDVRLVVGPALGIRGIVVDEKGAPLAHAAATVNLFGNDDAAQTGADGKFVIAPLSSHERMLLVTAPGRVPVRRFAVRPGAADVRVVLRPGATIAGRLLKSDGSPDKGRVVRALSAKASWAAADLWRATTDAEGRFELTGLDDGEWMLESVETTEDGKETSASLGTFKSGARDVELKPPAK